MAKHKRELKKSLQDLVWDMHKFGKQLRKTYKGYEKLKGDTEVLVLQYMSKKRKND